MKFVKLQWCRSNHIVNNQHLRQMKLEGPGPQIEQHCFDAGGKGK